MILFIIYVEYKLIKILIIESCKVMGLFVKCYYSSLKFWLNYDFGMKCFLIISLIVLKYYLEERFS